MFSAKSKHWDVVWTRRGAGPLCLLDLAPVLVQPSDVRSWYQICVTADPVSWCFSSCFQAQFENILQKTKRKIITYLDLRLNFTLSGDFKAIIHNEQDTASKRVAKHIFTWQAGLINRAQRRMTTIEVKSFFYLNSCYLTLYMCK